MITYRITIYDAATGETIERDMTADETDLVETDAANAYSLAPVPE